MVALPPPSTTGHPPSPSRRSHTTTKGDRGRSGSGRAIAPAAQEVVSLKDCSMLAMIGKIVAFQLPAAFPSGAVMKMA
jgi:hypothetical protein